MATTIQTKPASCQQEAHNQASLYNLLTNEILWIEKAV